MGWLADQLAKWRGEATKAATVGAAKAAAATAGKAVSSVGEDFLGFAERELARAQGERGQKTEDAAETTEGAPDGEAATAGEGTQPPPKSAAVLRAEREARARDELAALKAARDRARGKG